MTTTYTYNISQITSGNFNQVQLTQEIVALNLTSASPVGLSVDGVIIYIYFTDTLSGGDQTTLTNAVVNHNGVQSTILGDGQILNIPVTVTNINTTTYKENMIFTFPGTNAGINVLKITALSYTTAGNYTIKIFDLTNFKSVAQAMFTNTNSTSCDLGTISNLSPNVSLWQIQTKTNNINNVALIKNLSVYY